VTGALRARLARVGSSPTRHSTRVLRATYPRAVSSLGREGVLIGRDCLTGNAFAHDPFLAYAAEGLDHLSNPNAVVSGKVGAGKSSLIKSYLARQAVFGRREYVFSSKPREYDDFAELVGAAVVRVAPGAGTILNPLDAVLTGESAADEAIRARRVKVVVGLFETLEGRTRRSDESSAISHALDEAVRCGPNPTLFDLLDLLRAPTRDMLAALHVDEAAWRERLYPLCQALHSLCHGEYAGLFAGPTSAGMDLDAHRIVYDLAPLTEAGELALPLFMGVTAGRLHNTLAAERRHNIIVVYEEGWRVLDHLGVVRSMRQSWKLARAYGVQNIIVVHRPGDLLGASDEGKVEAKLALGLLQDSATKIVYAPEAQERDATGRMLALTADETAALSDLQVGEALWRIDDRSTIVRHLMSELERRCFATDEAMLRQGAAHAV
jgi:type IV secretory pathway VirB4 component